MRKTINLIIAVLLFITILFSCYILNIAQQKQDYTNQVHVELQKFLQQQTYSLQNLNNHILSSLRLRDYKQVSKYLSAYEDVIFGLARQGYTLAGDIQYVSLSAPQVIVSSKGLLNEHALVPDEQYYSLLVDDPYKLVVSRQFIKPEMPDYPMIHFGLSVMDSMQNFYGVLDIQIACKLVHDYIAKRVQHNPIFAFELVDGTFDAPNFVIDKRELFIAGFSYILGRLVLAVIIALGIYFAHKFVLRSRKQFKDIKRLYSELDIATTKLNLQDQALEIQHKYAAMDPYGEVEQRVNLPQLLRDVVAVNAQAAYVRGIIVNLEIATNANILVAYNRVLLMRVLAGVLYETILQLQSGCVVTINLSINNYAHNQQKIEFCFKDNGYYEELHGREVVLSNSDIRCFGWQNLMSLLAEYDIGLEHVHQMYKGNVLKLNIITKFVNNVVSFEKHSVAEEDL